jgi:glycosyltransferase involved in cell wall biosynthesis
MRIGFIATRLSGTDGVTLEVEKWAKVLGRMGHQIFFCAGELNGYAREGTLIPKLHFAERSIFELSQRAFGEKAENDGHKLADQIYEQADGLRTPIRKFIRDNDLDLIVVQNALTIPMNLPLGVCLTGLIAELGINTIAHHHDFFWERNRYQTNAILDLLDTSFPAKLPTIQHITINSIAQARLKARRHIDSIVIPNVFDFSTHPVELDDYNRDFRSALNIAAQDVFVLQPTRVIQRKGIEMSIELVQRLNLPNSRLFISHEAGDEGTAYWHWLQREAHVMGVDVELISHLIGPERSNYRGHKIYSLWDAYANADLITFPSLYEGFGNALLETVFYKRLAVVNRYPVYNADIKPLGFRFIELDGFVDPGAVEQVKALINKPDEVRDMVETNFQLGDKYFSFIVLEEKLREVINNF